MTNESHKPLRGILVGCGFMGGMHAQVYSQLDGVELVAVVDINRESSLEKLRKLQCQAPLFETLAEALAEVECDFVDVCLPTHLHRDFALQAIEAGKALFCEKPLALTLEEGNEIVAAAQHHGTLAQVGHCIRFWPEYLALTQYYRNGSAGRLLSLNLVRRGGRPGYSVGNWLNDQTLSGGAALDLHIHDTDFVLALLGQPKSFNSRVTEDFSGPVHIFTLFEYESLTVSAEGGWNYPKNWGFQMAFQAVFENAVLDYDSSNGKGLMICEADGEPRSLEVSKPEAGESVIGEGNVSDLGGYYNQLVYFTRCLREGNAPRIATLQDACASLALTIHEITAAKSL